MYIFAGIFIALCIIFLILNSHRRRKIVQKLCCMDSSEKEALLNEIIRPFGFIYDQCEDIFFSATDAWQYGFGYRALFDRAAPHFNMVFDCEPVYFDYNDQTWLIQFWKGQYGINTGAEIGIYRANRLLSPEEYPSAQFYSVPKDQMLPMSMVLEHCSRTLFRNRMIHWWLTGFRMGCFSNPEDLTMHISIAFPDCAMKESFMESLQKLGYDIRCFCCCGNTVAFTFSSPRSSQSFLFQRFIKGFSQYKNRLLVRLFCLITRPYTCTADRLLYLYDYLPFAFRRTVRIRCSSGMENRLLKKQFRTERKLRQKKSFRSCKGERQS